MSKHSRKSLFRVHYIDKPTKPKFKHKRVELESKPFLIDGMNREMALETFMMHQKLESQSTKLISTPIDKLEIYQLKNLEQNIRDIIVLNMKYITLETATALRQKWIDIITELRKRS